MDYSQQSFTKIYEELISIVEASTTKWSPRNSNESSPGLVILKLLALLEDKFNYKFDMSIAQAYLDTVSNLEQAQELFRMLGYTMRTARAAQGEISISTKQTLTEGRVIPHHSIITNTNKTISFFTTDDVEVLNGTLPTASIPVKVIAGKPFKITKNGIESFILKDLDEDGRLTLGKTGLAQNGVFVYTEDDDNIKNDWKYLDLALAMPKGTKYYTVSTLPSGEGYIQFPPDFETLINTDKLSIYGTHTTGASTNITKNTLSQFEDSTLNQLFLISQGDSFDNGQDSESIQQARTNYYRQIDVCNTLVSGEDFRNAIISLTNDSGDKLFSSAVTNTSQDRAIRIRSTYKNKNFIHIVPDSEPNKIEVTPLENNSDYIKSFKIATNATTSSEISEALNKGYRALGTVISATDNTTCRCSELYERYISGYDSTRVNVSYDDCNPFGMIAGDFGEIASLSKHTTQTLDYNTMVSFLNLSDLFATFMGNFTIPTDGTEYIPTIGSDALDDYTLFYNKAIELYNSSLVPFTQNVSNDLSRSAVIGVNHPYTMAFGTDVSPELINFQTVIANLFGFSSKTDFMNYAQNLANTYTQHRTNITNSAPTNEALNNGCFYTNNGSFVFPIAVTNELSYTVLAYVILDTSGLVSVWVNDITAALWATNFNSSYHTTSIIDNELYCKNILFVTGPTTSSNPRLLAVTTPRMTVRISGYTDAKAYQLKQSIKNYFYSRFRADYVEPGQALDYNEIVTSIKKLSSSIQSISMDEPTYLTYKNYNPVDGVTSKLAIADADIRNNIITRTVLSGDIPLFKYSNRPNTLSKKSSMYTSLLTSQEVIANNDLEVTTPIPFGCATVTQIADQGNPDITDFVPMGALDPDDGWVTATLYDAHILQFRRKHYESTGAYTSGMKYAFYSEYHCTLTGARDIITDATIKANSQFKENSILKTATTKQLLGEIDVYNWNSELGESGEWESAPSTTSELLAGTRYKLAQDVTILGDLELSSSSWIASGSIIVPKSTIDGLRFQPKILENPTDDARYELKVGDVLIIANSSGRIERTLKPGECISTVAMQEGLPVQGPTQQTIPTYQGPLLTSQTISVTASSKCIIDNKYAYLLSIYGGDTLVLDENNSYSYMLEEDEFFLYADKSLAEYIVLGPGTLLKSATSVTLKNRPMASIETLNDLSLFTSIVSTITAESYDLTTYRGPNREVRIHTANTVLSEAGSGTYKLPITWTEIGTSDSNPISVYDTKSSPETEIGKFSGEDYYEMRLVGLLKSDDEGIVHIPQGMSFTLGETAIVTGNILSTSVPITKLLTKSTGMKLLQPGITSNIKKLTSLQINPGDNYRVEREGADYITIKALTNEGGNITIPMITSGDGKMALANILIELPPNSAGGKISITDSGGVNYIPLLSDPNITIMNKPLSEFSTIKKTIDLTGLSEFIITLSPEEGKDLTDTIINLTDLSYTTSLSSELSSTREASSQEKTIINSLSATTIVAGIKTVVSSANLEYFNWLSYPKEELTNPLVSKNFFNKEHPYNKNTYPYIEYADQKIKIIGG